MDSPEVVRSNTANMHLRVACGACGQDKYQIAHVFPQASPEQSATKKRGYSVRFRDWLPKNNEPG